MQLKQNSIPEELKKLPCWCCYDLEPGDKKPRKVPKNALTGGNAQSNNESTWCTYEEAVEGLYKYGFRGLGFFFKPPYFGVDIDDVADEIQIYKDGQDSIVTEFVHTLRSYTELSQSGNGIHIICKGTLPAGGRRKGKVEMYQNGRFFIMTAKPISEYTEINECTETIKTLHEKYIGGDTSKKFQQISTPSASDIEIIELARKSKQGAKFEMLYNGQWEGFYNSQSDADIALCNMLAFWTRKDYMQMDSIFRTSGLMRDKWDRKQAGTTYGQITLSKAIADCNEVYDPKQVSVDGFSIRIDWDKDSKDNPNDKVYSYDDTGNAEYFTAWCDGETRYNYTNKQWMYWDGRKWTNDECGRIKVYADTFIADMGRNYLGRIDPDDSSMMKATQNHIKKTRSSSSKEHFLKESQHRMPIEQHQLDKDLYLFNTTNGTLNLRTGELLSHDKEKFISKISYAEYTDKQDTPAWNEFLNTTFGGDKNLIRFMQKAVGLSLSGDTSEQCLFICYGSGSNGKGVFMDTIAHILGTYATNVQADTLAIKKGPSNNANSDIARLVGARLVTCNEFGESTRFNEALIKQLTGQDTVTARRLYGNEFEYKPQFKLWILTNHKPIIVGTDNGIWRRIRLIPFTTTIPDHKQDKNLKYKLLGEIAGILNWALEGYLMWQKEGLGTCTAVQEATKEYRQESDSLQRFLDECTIQDKTSIVRANELYEAYREWVSTNGEYLLSNTKFGKEMAVKLKRDRDMKSIFYKDLKLFNEPYQVTF